jgi:hypothetical protein
MWKQALIDKSVQLSSQLLICLQVFSSIGQTEFFLNYTLGSVCSHPVVKHCGSGHLQFLTMLTLDSNGSWLGNDLWNDLNKSQKAYFTSFLQISLLSTWQFTCCLHLLYLQEQSICNCWRAGWFWFKWASPNKFQCASQHLTARLQGTCPKTKLKSFKTSKSASLGHFPYRQRQLLDRCLIQLAAWNWKNFIPSSGLQGLPITLSSDQFTCICYTSFQCRFTTLWN